MASMKTVALLFGCVVAMMSWQADAAALTQTGLLAAGSMLLGAAPGAAFFDMGDEDEDGDETAMFQVGVKSTEKAGRITGVPVAPSDSDCGWGEDCGEEEEDGAMFMQASVKESKGA